MRIAVTADPDIPIPPEYYGGIERVIYGLVQALAVRGQEVTLFASADSRVDCPLVPLRPAAGRAAIAANALTLWREHRRRQFDVIHSFGRLAYLLPLLPTSVRKLMTYQRYVTPRSIRWGTAMSHGTLEYTAISQHMIREVADLGVWHVVPNCVPVDRFDFVERVEVDAPLVFLGRIEWIKGTHLAIAIARESGRRLIIAGNVPAAAGDYFDAEVAPHIDDVAVRYVGPVNDADKNALLGRAAALLMPILWAEPFGIVMAEALACGTPVLGLARGAVPEVVDDGVNGFIAVSAQELARRVARIPDISRAACRASAEQHYSVATITEAYLALYAPREGLTTANTDSLRPVG